MNKQKTDWGYVEWIRKPETQPAMSVRRVVCYPGKEMFPHIHYEEQFIYVLEGYGTGQVNGRKQKIEPGAMYFMECGCEHSMKNEGSGPVIYLLITNAVQVEMNHHFLFNTLNQMASMALEGGGIHLYQSIIHLSRMLHYSTQTPGTLVSLKNELEYVESYLMLQKFRYKNTLEFYFDLDDNVQNVIVPFNFLQPLAENAFTHGGEEEPNKYMEIQVRDRKENIEIKIINKGKPLLERESQWGENGFKENAGHGLGMVYHKLESFYGDEFSMNICTNEGATVFCVRLPL